MSRSVYLDHDDDDDYRDRRRPRHRADDDRSMMILILGIISVTVFAPAGIAAWIMGAKDLAAMRAGRMDRAGKENTRIGYILGIVGTCLFVVGIIVFVCVLTLFFMVVPK